MGIFHPLPAGPAAQVVQVNFLSSMTASQTAAFEEAQDRWNSIIVEELAPVTVNGQLTTKILIDASVINIDGSGGTLGQAGPTSLRPGSFHPATGVMEFDSADLAGLENAGLLDDVIFHEMGHVIGLLYSVWDLMGLVSGENTNDPRFLGANAIAEYSTLTGGTETFVPLEHSTGPGSNDSHIEESTFGNEIMTPTINSSNQLSRITIGMLEDMGYVVDYSQADLYLVPLLSPLTADIKFSCCSNKNLELELIPPEGE